MLFAWPKTRYSPIAVDFGADSLKLLQVERGDPPRLIAAAAAPLPPAARQEPSGRSSFYAQTLPQLLRSAPFVGRRAICSLPAYQTLVQHFDVNPGNPASMDSQVEAYLRQRLNVDPGRMVIRTFAVDAGGSPKGRQEIICIAAAREAVMRLIGICHQAKLDIVGMHCEPLAILQSFAHLYRRKTDAHRVTCFVDIGAITTKVVIARGREMVFAKTIHAAGDHFTRGASRLSGQTFEQARTTRWEYAATAPELKLDAVPGLAGTIDAGADEAGDGDAQDTLDAAPRMPHTADVAPQATGAACALGLAAERVRTPAFHEETLECLLDEMQLCIRHHHSRSSDQPIEKLVFVGGESRHIELCQRIARELQIGAQLGDPLARLVRPQGQGAPCCVDTRVPQPGWAVPVGLCLSEPNL